MHGCYAGKARPISLFCIFRSLSFDQRETTGLTSQLSVMNPNYIYPSASQSQPSDSQQAFREQSYYAVNSPAAQGTDAQTLSRSLAPQSLPHAYPQQLMRVFSPPPPGPFNMRAVSTPMIGQTSYQNMTTTTTTTTTSTNNANRQASSYILQQQTAPSVYGGHSTASAMQTSSVNVPPTQPAPMHPPAQTRASFEALEALKVPPPPPTSNIAHIMTCAAAEQQSTRALQAFDDRVNDLLTRSGVALGVCLMAYRWYPSKYGCSCGGGNHLVPVPEAEALLQGHRPFGPQVELINSMGPVVPVMQPDGSWRPEYTLQPRMRYLTPPPLGWDGPTHLDPVNRILTDTSPVPKNHKGEWYSRKEMLKAAAISVRPERRMGMHARHAEGVARRLAQFQNNWTDPSYQWNAPRTDPKITDARISVCWNTMDSYRIELPAQLSWCSLICHLYEHSCRAFVFLNESHMLPTQAAMKVWLLIQRRLRLSK